MWSPPVPPAICARAIYSPAKPACAGAAPYQPSVNDLHQNGRQFPPNYLHESWMDYLYWDSVLEP